MLVYYCLWSIKFGNRVVSKAPRLDAEEYYSPSHKCLRLNIFITIEFRLLIEYEKNIFYSSYKMTAFVVKSQPWCITALKLGLNVNNQN